MRSEFDKQKTSGGIQLGKNAETGVIILDEDPQWVWIREDASGSYIELRLDKEYGYVLNIIQGEFEQYDFELGGIENAITIHYSSSKIGLFLFEKKTVIDLLLIVVHVLHVC